MKRLAFLLLAALGILGSAGLRGDTIISVTGPQDGGYGFGSTGSGSVGASWIQSSAFTGVSIDAVLGSNFSGTTGTAYVTNQIGPSATVANEIASAPFAFPVGGAADINLFSGLTLTAGTYYLVLSTTGNGFWEFTNNQTVTTAPGVSFNSDYLSTSNNAYPPASNFNPTNAGFLFSVTGTSVPEPSTVTFLLLSAGVVAVARLMLP
jgi:hypothetical protein